MHYAMRIVLCLLYYAGAVRLTGAEGVSRESALKQFMTRQWHFSQDLRDDSRLAVSLLKPEQLFTGERQDGVAPRQWNLSCSRHRSTMTNPARLQNRRSFAVTAPIAEHKDAAPL